MMLEDEFEPTRIISRSFKGGSLDGKVQYVAFGIDSVRMGDEVWRLNQYSQRFELEKPEVKTRLGAEVKRPTDILDFYFRCNFSMGYLAQLDNLDEFLKYNLEERMFELFELIKEKLKEKE